MTESSPQAETRRPGVLGIHSLDHFSMTVPKLAEAARFYGAFGLDVRNEKDGLGIYTFGHKHRWAILREGPHKKLDYLSFGAFEDDIPRFAEQLKRANAEMLRTPANADAESLWFLENNGIPFEIKAAEKTSPSGKHPDSSWAVRPQPGSQGAPARGRAPTVFPSRLTHCLLWARDLPETTAFYKKTLGLRLSDEAGESAFLHAVHGCDHHVVGMVQSDNPGFHHCSWITGSIQEVGQGAMQMADKGYAQGWGMGRHVLGSNYFHYVRDPWGSFCEYAYDIDYIPVDHDWKEGHYSPDSGLYLWGPTPPDYFFHSTDAPGRSRIR